MRQYCKVLLAGLMASLLLGAAVGTASATRLSTSNRAIRVVWTPLTLEAAGARVRCNVTLEGSFHANTIVKAPGSLIGYISRAILGSLCTGGTATILGASLPWHLTYEGFSGVLPRITAISMLLLNASFRVDPDGILPACLARTEREENVSGQATRDTTTGAITGLVADETDGIELEGGGLCGLGVGHFSGTGRVTLLGNTTSIIVRLI